MLNVLLPVHVVLHFEKTITMWTFKHVIKFLMNGSHLANTLEVIGKVIQGLFFDGLISCCLFFNTVTVSNKGFHIKH